MQQPYAASEEFNAWKSHNVAAFSIVAFASVAYLGHVLVHRQERARRIKNAQIASMELVEEAEAKKETMGCALCEKHKRLPSTASTITSASTPLIGASPKKPKREKKAKSVSVAPREVSQTRSVAVQTEPEVAPRPYPPDEILAFSRTRNDTSSSSFNLTDDDVSDMGLSERSPSLNRSSQPIASTSKLRDASLSSRSVSTEASSEDSTQMRRRSSSGATSLSMASTSAMTPLDDDQGFMTPSSSVRKGRKARQKEREVSSRREVVGMPKPPVSRQNSLPVPPVSVSRSNTLKAATSSESYWTQNPVAAAKPATRPSSAMSNRSGTSVKSLGKQPELPSRKASLETPSTGGGAHERSTTLPPMPMPFSPPISPSPHRAHSNGSHYSMPPSPSPSLPARPPSYTASSFDAIAAAQQAAYLLAQQQAYLQQQPRSPMGGFFPAHPMAYHPNYGMPMPQMPPMLVNARRSSSLSLSSEQGESKHEMDRLREQVQRLRERGKRAEIENERKNKELEIAKWRLECVEVERKQEDLQVRLFSFSSCSFS